MDTMILSMEEAVSRFIGEGDAVVLGTALEVAIPCAVVTTKGVLRFDPITREMMIQSVHPGSTLEDILENTGWNVRLAPRIERTKPPTPSELKIIRKHDPRGFWTKGI
jgi:acyl CoA:acetate/3-ketoacid CoA transferase beta subunit